MPMSVGAKILVLNKYSIVCKQTQCDVTGYHSNSLN